MLLFKITGLTLYNLLFSEYRIGWEQTLYQVDEEIGSLELCLIVMSETTLQDSASFRVSTIPGSAAGK